MDRACPDRGLQNPQLPTVATTRNGLWVLMDKCCARRLTVGVYAHTKKGMNLEPEEQPSQPHCVPVSCAGTVSLLTQYKRQQ